MGLTHGLVLKITVKGRYNTTFRGKVGPCPQDKSRTKIRSAGPDILVFCQPQVSLRDKYRGIAVKLW